MSSIPSHTQRNIKHETLGKGEDLSLPGIAGCVCVWLGQAYTDPGARFWFLFAGDLGMAAGLASYVARCAYMAGTGGWR